MKRFITAGLQLIHLGLVVLIAMACEGVLASVLAWSYSALNLAAVLFLLARRSSGWVASLGLAGTSTVLFVGWMAASLWAYFSGAFLYKDSPASIIVAVLVGVAGFVPSCLLLAALLIWRRDIL